MRAAHERRSADAWVFGLFLALLFWAPLPLGSARPWAWTILELGIYFLAACWLALWAFGRARVRAPCREAWPVLTLFAIWLAIVGVQLLPLPREMAEIISPESLRVWLDAGRFAERGYPVSTEPEATTVFLLKSLAYALAFFLTLVLADRRERLKALAFTLVASGLLQALYASFGHLLQLQYEFAFTPLNHGDRAIGTFRNPDHLAGYLELALSVGIGMMIGTLRERAPRTWRQRLRDWVGWMISPRILLRLVLVVMVIALVMTRSRGGNGAFFASMLVAGALGLALSRHATRSVVILIASLVVIDVFIVGAWFGVDKVMHRLEQTSLTRDARAVAGTSEQSLEERGDPALFALNMARDYPWLGSGGGTFASTFMKYRTEELAGDFYVNAAHNDYAQFLVETGVIGLALMGLVVLLCFVTALKAQYQRTDPLARGVAFGATMGIVSLMIHSWVDFNLQTPSNALTFVVVLAMAWPAAYVGRQRHASESEEDRAAAGTAPG
ncbi:MAG: hypothetical protein A3G25_12530 [Betaproteobacteria bacterium RIFCSPLOWO2_12_FULL_63_13]|nr:MAG: hypothetical protein A3G25_12530 [Betaproteobacteria bacterium RIFCSPLOWO2_12_FULL_63_13]